jgi:hypothetical protein
LEKEEDGGDPSKFAMGGVAVRILAAYGRGQQVFYRIEWNNTCFAGPTVLQFGATRRK